MYTLTYGSVWGSLWVYILLSVHIGDYSHASQTRCDFLEETDLTAISRCGVQTVFLKFVRASKLDVLDKWLHKLHFVEAHNFTKLKPLLEKIHVYWQ